MNSDQQNAETVAPPPAVAPVEAPEPSLSSAHIIKAGALVAGTVLATGCGGGGGGGGGDAGGAGLGLALVQQQQAAFQTAPDTVITGLSVSASADAGETMEISGEPSALHEIRLDGGSSAASAGQDPGPGSESVVITVPVRSLAGTTETDAASVVLTINPNLAQVESADPINAGLGKHLQLRSGFGVDVDDLGRAMALPWAQVVDEMLDATSTEARTRAPAWVDDYLYSWRERRDLSQAERDALSDRINAANQEIKTWWYQEMITTTTPLTERMILFWHNIWTSDLAATPYAQLMWNQHQLIRQHAVGSFAELARAMPKDPAMVLYLDSDSNVKGSPNENFARELVELFSLGEGRDYDEADIPEIARTFTGYGLTPNFAFRFNADDHDDGTKTIFGETGTFTGDDVIEMILSKRRCAEYIVENLWDEFIATPQDAGEISRLTDIYFASGYDTKAVLRALFTSSFFLDPMARATHIRSPVELLVTAYRSVNAEPENYRSLIWKGRDMEQDIFQPPNVRGWQGGTRWINSQSLINRRRHMRSIGWELDDKVPPRLAGGLRSLLLVTDPVSDIDTSRVDREFRDLLRDPTYNLG